MKIIEFADAHIDPKWIDDMLPCFQLLAQTGKENIISAFVLGADWFNRPLYATDKDKYSTVMFYAKMLLRVAPVVCVTGTNSHDGPGSYSVLKELGFTVIGAQEPQVIGGVLFMGLPEINKIQFMKTHKWTADQASQEIKKVIQFIISDHFIPHRKMHKDKPAVFIGHGVYVDGIKDNDIIAKNTDIVIDNNWLKPCNFTRVVLGHYHTPKQSSILPGGYVGYMGFDNKPWSNFGFQPGFNLTDLSTGEVKRIDYPVIRREKIKWEDAWPLTGLTSKYKIQKGVDLKIKYEISKERLKQIDLKELEKSVTETNNLHSCIIEPIFIQESSGRITTEEKENIKSLRDLYKLFDKTTAVERVLKKVDILESEVSKKINTNTVAKQIDLVSLEVQGSWGSIDGQGVNTFYHDFENDPHGLTAIYGPNGKGKSFFFGFANIHGVFIGFDYKTMKDLFVDSNGSIEIKFKVNGVLHRHYITIRKSKVECFWYAGEEIFFKSTSPKEFQAKCIEEFGSLETFIATSFHVQDSALMKNTVSSLTHATASKLRDIYMQIVGIDRTAEREYSKNERDKTQQEINSLEIKLQSLNEFVADKDTIEKELREAKVSESKLNTEKADLENKLRAKQTIFDRVEKSYEQQKQTQAQLEIIGGQIENAKTTMFDLEQKIKAVNTENIDIEKLQNTIDKNENDKKILEDYREQYRKQQDFANKLGNDITGYDNRIEINNRTIEQFESEIKYLNKKCENCGEIPYKNSKEIIEEKNKKTKSIQAEIQAINKSIEETKIAMDKIFNKIQQIKKEADSITLIPDTEINKYKQQIKDFQSIKSYSDRVEALKTELAANQKTYNDKIGSINDFLEDDYNITKTELNQLKQDLTATKSDIGMKTGFIEATEKQLTKLKQNQAEIENILKQLDLLVIDLEDWKSIYNNFEGRKIPGLELDLIAKEIDAEVNKILQGKYSIETKTQDINQKGEIVDRFDIVVYNHETGNEKSLINHSGGQKVWLDEAITKVLREKRQKREGIIFNWSFSDEPDGALQHDAIEPYYQIIDNLLQENHKRYVVTHAREALSYIQNKLSVFDLSADNKTD